MKRTSRSLVDKAMAQVTTYTTEQARALHGHPGVQFVDVRDIRELEREGVIPGAVHAPRGMLEFWVDPESPYHRDVFAQDKEYVLSCAAGWRSALATRTLQEMGLENVAHVEGGFEAWKKAGGPVAEKAQKVMRPIRPMRPRRPRSPRSPRARRHEGGPGVGPAALPAHPGTRQPPGQPSPARCDDGAFA